MRTPITAVGLAGLVWVPTGTTGAEAGAAECVRPTGVQRIEFSAQKYPNVRRHFRGAVRRGWPRRLVVTVGVRMPDVIDCCGISRPVRVRPRRVPASGWTGTRAGAGAWPEPARWKADVRNVPSSENRSHGALLGGQLERFCNGTRFRYVFG